MFVLLSLVEFGCAFYLYINFYWIRFDVIILYFTLNQINMLHKPKYAHVQVYKLIQRTSIAQETSKQARREHLKFNVRTLFMIYKFCGRIYFPNLFLSCHSTSIAWRLWGERNRKIHFFSAIGCEGWLLWKYCHCIVYCLNVTFDILSMCEMLWHTHCQHVIEFVQKTDFVLLRIPPTIAHISAFEISSRDYSLSER